MMRWDWEVPPEVLSWLLTFATHGTALLLATFVVCRVFRRMPDPVRETLWKAALVCPLLTTSLQVGLEHEPVGGHFAVLEASTDLPFREETTALPGAALALDAAAAPVVTLPEPLPEPVAEPVPSPSWEQGLLLGIVGLSLVSLVCRARSGRRLRLALRRREKVVDGELVDTLQRLARQAGYRRRIRLSMSVELGTPVAFGVLRPEICLPTKVAARLRGDQRLAVLGHELGHHVRRDPLWLGIFGALAALFAWQLLIRVARTQYQRIAEYRCDAFAAKLAGPLPVARCLLDVADLVSRPWQRMPSSAWAMAAAGSMLKQRVDRLLTGGRTQRSGWHRLWMVPALPGALLTMILALPGVGIDSLETVDAVEEPAPGAPAGPPEAPASPTAALIAAMDVQWELLHEEIRALEALVDELPNDAESMHIRKLRALLMTKVRAFEAHRERIRVLVEGGNR